MAVLVVGDANPDLVLTGDVVPRFGQAEQDVAAEIALGGSGAIAAAALARLGVEVAIAAAVGDDDLGRVVAARLEARGVARTALQRSARPTGLSVHLLRGVDRAILTSAGAIADLDVAAACATIAAGVRHVHLSSVYLIPPLVAGGGRVLAAARAARATVSVDTNFDPSGAFAVPDWLRAADVILPNAAEARAMTGRDDVADAARDLAAEGATVAVKLGAADALGVAGPDGGVVRADAPPAPEVVDAVGAGDAFDAGFLRARLDDRPLADALALGCACGTLSLRARGDAGHPTLGEALARAGIAA
jgi:ribokinase